MDSVWKFPACFSRFGDVYRHVATEKKLKTNDTPMFYNTCCHCPNRFAKCTKIPAEESHLMTSAQLQNQAEAVQASGKDMKDVPGKPLPSSFKIDKMGVPRSQNIEISAVFWDWVEFVPESFMWGTQTI